jgi:hypothetical protein
MVLTPGASPATDPAPASWLAAQLLRAGTAAGTPVGAVVPAGFAAYARVFHPAWSGEPGGRPVTWGEVAEWAGRVSHPAMQWEAIARPARDPNGATPWAVEPSYGWTPPEVRLPLADVLRAHTRSPAECWALVWTGFGGLEPDAFPDAARVDLPWREYILVRATLDVIARGLLRSPAGELAGPNLWWPDDRAWCVASEIDFRWTYVAGSAASIADVLGAPLLEALPVRVEDRADYRSDTINGPVAPR